MANVINALGKTASTIGGKLSSLASSKAGKAALTGAGIGGGSYLALSGVGAGVENVLEGTGLGGIVKAVNPSVGDSGSKGWGTIIGIGILAGIALLLVFVIMPKGNRNRGGRSNA